jgi:hypothetical protein
MSSPWALSEMPEEPEFKSPKRLTTPIELTDLSLASAKASQKLRVFVAGPYIRKDWDAAERQNRDASALLRIELVDYVESHMQHTAVLGEHRGVVEVGDRRFGSRSSAAITEIEMVRRTCQAVVIIPSSPGSFCELGAWALYEDVCRKLLILSDANFEGKEGYLNLGVLRTAADFGAIITWIDYRDHDKAKEEVYRHLSRIEDITLVK